ncbi:uncharacterized protein DNG_08947 [Cephalotrichum gorgonifer]|uniref:Mesaconyl-C4 CoA hydratase n=1 Tax=Cephalotrichum gorgonifer TaxID=2041049 RepID=A0AAE8N6K3_9PEZI|nr:uncharacterized protein DNG_08947 [Cephalotrichum gorgonifer]
MISRRLFSTANCSLGHEVASEFLSRAQQRGPLVQKQLLDGNQLQRLGQTLGRRELLRGVPVAGDASANGTALPPGYHLVYFTPSAFESELGRDGSDKTFNPSSPFTRRMWAGGEMIWSRDNLLRVGEVVIETTSVVKAEPKRTRDGTDMIVVGVKKRFENEAGTALVDKRDWVFRPALTEPPVLTPRGEPKPFPTGAHTRDFEQTPVSLFRFSALTFNGHKIHYSKEWCRKAEGHRDIVVHGALNLINSLDLWRDSRGSGGDEFPTSIRYRATSPVYSGEPYRAVLEDSGAEDAEVKFWTEDGRMALQATISS